MFSRIMVFLCVSALAPWRLPTPGGVVLGGESRNRFELLSLGRHGNIHAYTAKSMIAFTGKRTER